MRLPLTLGIGTALGTASGIGTASETASGTASGTALGIGESEKGMGLGKTRRVRFQTVDRNELSKARKE